MYDASDYQTVFALFYFLITLPLISVRGTGPKLRESVLAFVLSPVRKYVYGPGIAVIRFTISSLGASGRYA